MTKPEIHAKSLKNRVLWLFNIKADVIKNHILKIFKNATFDGKIHGQYFSMLEEKFQEDFSKINFSERDKTRYLNELVRDGFLLEKWEGEGRMRRAITDTGEDKLKCGGFVLSKIKKYLAEFILVVLASIAAWFLQNNVLN